MTKYLKQGIFSSAALHIIAMALMLSDHLWATFFPYLDVMTCAGRLAFPVFAFLTAEGSVRTGNRKRYLERLLLFALISEVPFDLVYGSTPVYLFHQNVLWTFLISVLLIAGIERVRKLGKLPLTIAASALALAAGALIGMATMVDYYHAGILTVLMFYFLRGKELWKLAAQLVCMYVINVELLGGLTYTVTLFGHTFGIVQQGFALLALPVIWLYNGQRGYHRKWFRWFCYGFYPAHLLILYLLWSSLGA